MTTKKIGVQLNILAELLATERNYVEGLKTLIDLFVSPLTKLSGTDKEIIPKEEIKTIFSDCQVILSFHEILLKDFESCFPNSQSLPKKQTLNQKLNAFAKVFQKNLKWMTFYSSYANKYPKSLVQLKKCRKKKKFRQFIQETESNERCHRLRIDDFLVSPLQRVPRYKLLLERLVKKTTKNTEEYNSLKNVYDQICSTAHKINEKKRDAENSFRVYEISEKLLTDGSEDINLFQWYRRLVKEGPLVRVKKNRKKNQSFMIFLFNDFLLLTKLRKSLTLGRVKYKVKQMHALSEIRKIRKIKDHPKLVKILTPTYKYIFEAHDKNERSDWIREIRNTIIKLNNISNSRLKPHLQKHSQTLIKQIDEMYKIRPSSTLPNNFSPIFTDQKISKDLMNAEKENKVSLTLRTSSEYIARQTSFNSKSPNNSPKEGGTRVRKFARLRRVQTSLTNQNSLKGLNPNLKFSPISPIKQNNHKTKKFKPNEKFKKKINNKNKKKYTPKVVKKISKPRAHTRLQNKYDSLTKNRKTPTSPKIAKLEITKKLKQHRSLSNSFKKQNQN
ncbi:faciogenital dysplasia protein [Anaeramoeba flamelloides]|uniref:Faciogenital dysplasia protein n=1 Tax=Anaeramoeba flamelloides TaxID=1746091 RepID=A0AAV7ZJ35_9EUKA|nr:faciogenital dysplasia protein [Anaeramoeba flamelloides]